MLIKLLLAYYWLISQPFPNQLTRNERLFPKNAVITNNFKVWKLNRKLLGCSDILTNYSCSGANHIFLRVLTELKLDKLLISEFSING